MIRSLAAQCASLANDYGATHGPHSPASFEVALCYLDPATGTLTEMPTSTTVYDDAGVASVVANGYARAAVANDGTAFPAPDPTTATLTTPTISGFPASLAEYPETATHWALIDPATGDWWDVAAFAPGDQITVAAAGVTPLPVLSIFYNDLTE